MTVGPPAGAERAATLYHLADALGEADDARAAFVAFDEAARFAAVSGDRSLEWLARIGRSEMQTEADPHSLSTDEFREELEEAISGFEELGDEAGLAAAWRKLAFLEFTPCRFDRAERAAHRAVAHARACDDDRLLIESLRTLLFAQAYGSTTPEEGYRTLDGLLEDVSRSRPIEASALAVRGAFEAMEGWFDEARRHVGLAVQIEEALGSKVMVAVYEAFLGDVEIEAGDAIAAERAFRRNYEIYDEMGHEGFKSTAAANLAGILCGLGRFDEAEGFAAIARNVAAEDDLSSQVFGRSAQAAVLAARGEPGEAERLAREAVQMLGVAESPGAQGAVRMDLARVLRLAGKPADAEHAAREALAFFERKGNRPSSDATRAFIAELVPPGRG